ncbi:MAG: DUF2851 family protein [Candidatus Abyssobacteria bacterium SURF_5]|uniref:DUF2851 family protein n=1 Tax=Abyssobacteria bacterium (strain SURF_5) TaxID=2093360 RepID=A0A3A4NBF6_ABYX5|nr:MAG: DUF2851 family protein [Candidatus Abyssubacteria bacterium SURF_5]
MAFSNEYFHLFDDVPAFGERIERNYLLASNGGRISERLLQCIWYDRLFDESRLETRDGRRIIIHSPGMWNLEAGPDFKNAQITIGRVRLCGDVELHVDSSSWRAHGHASDPQYDNVILHVVLSGRPGDSPPLGRRGAKIPELVLWDRLADSLGVLRCALRPEEYPYRSMCNFGRCQALLEHLPAEAIQRLLLLSGDARIIVKQRRFGYETERTNLDQITYSAVLEGMGYKAFTKQFGLLARKLPYVRLRERVLSVNPANGLDAALLTQALLLGSAGLLASADDDEKSPAAKKHYDRLRKLWGEFGFSDEDGKMEWKGAAVRPANRPERRIAGISHVLARSYGGGLFQAVLERVLLPARRRAQAQCISFLTDARDDFWSFHYSAHGKRFERPAAIVGRDRAQTILVNAFIPLALLYARTEQSAEKEERVHEIFCGMPSLLPNSITRLMEYRMFGGEQKGRLFKSARAQQGLLQIFADWCSEDPSCENCGIFAGLQSGYIGEKLMDASSTVI